LAYSYSVELDIFTFVMITGKIQNLSLQLLCLITHCLRFFVKLFQMSSLAFLNNR